LIEGEQVIIRSTQRCDATGIASVLEALVLSGKRKKRSDAAFALSHYIEHPNRIECVVAIGADGDVLGFQSLKRALKDNVYGAPVGWGIIGSHINPKAARRGVGTALFQTTYNVAHAAGVPAIDASIGEANVQGQAFYEAMGFRDYRTATGAVCKALRVV